MRQRDRLSIRAFQDEEEARERAERERKEAPIREATKTFNHNFRKLHAVTRERISQNRDDELYITPELRNAKMPNAEALQFNKSEAARFVRECPEYEGYRSDDTFQAISDYFERNGIRIADAPTIRAAFYRLKEYGLIHPRLPESEPEPVVEPVEINNPALVEELPEGWMRGFDLDTGAERDYSPVEIDRMPADTFRRVFRILSSDLVLPNIGPGPGGQA